ncbi:unnamed protein product [Owenia fusiformis]|uniref:SH3 domain-binding protein 5-like protein n=1 Tax=Owenia fusiformis TaxID=6347 RepID=A0A8S4P7R4_OWEFU|nr:unnamed protein product [Owenia fusiformis]
MSCTVEEDDIETENPDNIEVDPRVQDELEKLNCSSDEINKLEIQLDEARNKFKTTLEDSTQKLNQIYKSSKRNIEKSRPYYDSVKTAKEAQTATQEAARRYQRAVGVYRAAKETVSLAEERMRATLKENREFDPAWQEMLNHATIKFMDSEKEKTQSERDHLSKSMHLSQVQHQVLILERSHKNNIRKSKAYFDMKFAVEGKLEEQKKNVEVLQKSVNEAKKRYSSVLQCLETISEQIHEKRQSKVWREARTPGVGADSDDMSDIYEFNIDNLGLDFDGDLCSEPTKSNTGTTDSLNASLSGLDSIDGLPTKRSSLFTEDDPENCPCPVCEDRQKNSVGEGQISDHDYLPLPAGASAGPSPSTSVSHMTSQDGLESIGVSSNTSLSNILDNIPHNEADTENEAHDHSEDYNEDEAGNNMTNVNVNINTVEAIEPPNDSINEKNIPENDAVFENEPVKETFQENEKVCDTLVMAILDTNENIPKIKIEENASGIKQQVIEEAGKH